MDRSSARFLIGSLVLLAAALSLEGCGPARGVITSSGVTVPSAARGIPSSGPVQPIDFRHNIHAGQYRIPCLYCHAYADKSPVANIPAVSVCMNCHKFVNGSTPEFDKQIQSVRDYFTRGEPIPWVSVYRLPDHAFFNHKRHVKAGLECQACHGPVETMERVYKYSSLKMGWCVKCHKANLHNTKFAASIDCYTCHR
ncbi:MAG: cytochrome c3 family protein [Candidatus Eisenbacteria bacterium]|nr:cytochrome c3 family protein [Candidatus Eisenbacteria bacterium]